MTTLPLETAFRGYTLTQIWRSDRAAIYEQRKGGKVRAFELVRIRVAPAAVIMGKSYLEREVYPGSEQWGVNGFTLLSLGAAMAKATSL